VVFDDISKKLGKIKGDSLLVFICEDFLYFNFCIKLTKVLVNDFNMAGVIVLINKDAVSFSDELEKKGVESKDIWLVDCVSLISGYTKPLMRKCIAVRHPGDYHELMIAVIMALSRLETEKKRFVMFVSPRALVRYTNPEDTGLFFREVSDVLKEKKTLDVVMLEKEISKVFKDIITGMADKIMVGS
jgi:hypothetical protein